jgi:DNA polymerase-3 subunit epsilon
MDFTAIDVETANPDFASICQIGVVQFHDGHVANRWTTFVNPEDFFDPVNVRIHGITAETVRSAPVFRDVKARLDPLLQSTVVCCHTAFDRLAVRAVHAKYRLDHLPLTWLDTSRVVRRAWPERSHSGYGIRPVAEMLGISFHHHDAEEDARVAGEILLHAMARTGLSVNEWLARVERPINEERTGGPATRTSRHGRAGNPDGPLSGEIVVFTGSLSFKRSEAVALAAAAGCNVAENVTKRTTLLVVGNQDIRALNGLEKSSKHRKAEQLITEGQELRILQECDFLSLLVVPPEP